MLYYVMLKLCNILIIIRDMLIKFIKKYMFFFLERLKWIKEIVCVGYNVIKWNCKRLMLIWKLYG